MLPMPVLLVAHFIDNNFYSPRPTIDLHNASSRPGTGHWSFHAVRIAVCAPALVVNREHAFGSDGADRALLTVACGLLGRPVPSPWVPVPAPTLVVFRLASSQLSCGPVHRHRSREGVGGIHTRAVGARGDRQLEWEGAKGFDGDLAAGAAL